MTRGGVVKAQVCHVNVGGEDASFDPIMFIVQSLRSDGFSLPMCAPSGLRRQMQEDFGVARSWADGVSQLVSPGLVQFISTPVHILGLDLYNHPASSAAERFRVVQEAFVPAIVLRVARIGVAFGVGCVGNNAIRDKLHAVVVS